MFTISQVLSVQLALGALADVLAHRAQNEPIILGAVIGKKITASKCGMVIWSCSHHIAEVPALYDVKVDVNQGSLQSAQSRAS
jgi:hypothetical protein